MPHNIHSERLLQEALGQVGSAVPIRFILVAGGSGNVYGVSRATDIQTALKEVVKDLVIMYNSEEGREAPEYDSVDTMLAKSPGAGVKDYNGYVIITLPQSDEGQFALLDTTSTNPEVQAEIKTMNLLKYAAEFEAEQAALDKENGGIAQTDEAATPKVEGADGNPDALLHFAQLFADAIPNGRGRHQILAAAGRSWEDVFDAIKAANEGYWYAHSQSDIIQLLAQVNASEKDANYVLDLHAISELERG